MNTLDARCTLATILLKASRCLERGGIAAGATRAWVWPGTLSGLERGCLLRKMHSTELLVFKQFSQLPSFPLAFEYLQISSAFGLIQTSQRACVGGSVFLTASSVATTPLTPGRLQSIPQAWVFACSLPSGCNCLPHLGWFLLGL